MLGLSMVFPEDTVLNFLSHTDYSSVSSLVEVPLIVFYLFFKIRKIALYN